MFKQVKMHDAILKFYQRSQPIAFSNAETLYDDLVLLRDQILMYGDLSEAQTNYLNNFIEVFDKTLSTTVRDIFEKWLGDGFLIDFLRGIINEEVVEARDGEVRLNIRLNRDKQTIINEITQLKGKDTEIITQLAEKAKQTSLNETNENIAGLNKRIDGIISTPTTVSEQEIIDARQNEQSLGANITKVKTNQTENKKVIERIGRKFSTVSTPNDNLIEQTTYERNKYRDSADGTIQEGTSTSGIDTMTDFIPVESLHLFHNKNASFSCFNLSKSFVGGITGGATNREITLPVETRFVVVSFKYSDIDELLVQISNTVFGKRRYAVNGFDSDSSFSKSIKNLNEYIDSEENLFNKNGGNTEGEYIDHTSGIWKKSGTSPQGFDFISHPMKIVGGKTYYNHKLYAMTYYDSDLQFISGELLKAYSFQPPINASIMIASYKKNDLEGLVISTTKTTLTSTNKYRLKGLQTEKENHKKMIEGINLKELGETTSYESITIEDDLYQSVTLTAPADGTSKIIKYITVDSQSNIIVSLQAKTSNVGNDKTSIQARFYRNGEEVTRPIIQRYDLTSNEYRDYRFRFAIPREIDMVRFSIYTRNGGIFKIRNISFENEVMPLARDSGIRFVGHRTLAQLAPENSMSGLELANRSGMWGVVINTGMTSDGVLISMHDLTVDRTTNGTGLVREMTYDQISQLECGSYFNEYYEGEPIPLLEDMLRFCSITGLHPILRLSRDFEDNPTALNKIYALVKKYNLEGKISAKGFEITTVVQLHAIAGSDIRYGFSAETYRESDVDIMKTLGDDSFMDIVAGITAVATVNAIKSKGVRVTTWTIDDFDLARYLIGIGISEFTTGSLTLQNCQF